MKARIVRIGNSQGVRIPKPILEQAGLRGEVDISAEKDAVVIRPAAHPRAGWAAAFRKMARQGTIACSMTLGQLSAEPVASLESPIWSESMEASWAAVR
jgi:antitoxin MazE